MKKTCKRFYQKTKNQKLITISGFTIMELVIAMVLLAILATIAFVSFNDYITNSKDVIRRENMEEFKVALGSTKQTRGALPIPKDNFSLTNSGMKVVFEGKLTNEVPLIGMDTIYQDPALNIPYIYSTTANRQEFQIAMTLDNNSNNIAYVDGNYYTVTESMLPSLILAISGTTSQEISSSFPVGVTNRAKFIINQSSLNLPYSLTDGNPVQKATSYSNAVEKFEKYIKRNTDFVNCDEIMDAKKFVGAGEYEVREELGGKLVKVLCSCTSTICNFQTVYSTGNVSGFAWGEMAGNIDMSFLSVSGTSFSGYAWGENMGWIDFNGASGATLSIIDSSPGIRKFSGYTWSENGGKINFNTDSTNQITIDSDGNFFGKARSELMGWINFTTQGVKVNQ